MGSVGSCHGPSLLQAVDALWDVDGCYRQPGRSRGRVLPNPVTIWVGISDPRDRSAEKKVGSKIGVLSCDQ